MPVGSVVSSLHHYGDDVSHLLGSARSFVAASGYQQPLLYLSRDQLRANVRRFMAAMPSVAPHFAVKANPDPRVLAVLRDEGVNFEIASGAELNLLLELDVRPELIFYSNPIKSETYLREAANWGVQWYGVDSVAEVQKIHRIYPGASLYLRISTSNLGSAWPLEGKFGVGTRDARAVMSECARLNMDLAGITFHVGSQCSNVHNWRQGIRSARLYFRRMEEQGLVPRLLNIGGGFPVCMTSGVPTIEEIGTVINRELASFDPSIRVIAEPGRNLVASAGCMVTQVIGTAVRNGQHWLYLDTGVYGGLMELNERFHYPIITDRRGAMRNWTLAGPTCDSIDVCIKNQLLPATMRSGDLIYLPYTGAYTACCATAFNGFPIPDVVVV